MRESRDVRVFVSVSRTALERSRPVCLRVVRLLRLDVTRLAYRVSTICHLAFCSLLTPQLCAWGCGVQLCPMALCPSSACCSPAGDADTDDRHFSGMRATKGPSRGRNNQGM